MKLGVSNSVRVLARNSAVAALAVVLATAPQRASALVVKTWNGPGTATLINNTAPADDPGWGNFGLNRRSVYLGDQWVLTATHNGVGRVDLPGGSYSTVPNSRVILTNPSSFAGRSLSNSSDLMMYRIRVEDDSGLTPEDQDPNVKPITLADHLPDGGEQLTLFGGGRRRSLNSSDANGQWHWDLINSTTKQLTTDLPADEHGFLIKTDSNNTRTWGTNVLASPSTLSGVVRSGNRVLIRSDSGFNDVVGFVTQFNRGLNDNDQPISDGSLPDEAQGAAGDSGSPVFYKDDGQWVLAGVMNAIYTKTHQKGNEALFDTHTAISDLSMSHYRDQIEALRSSKLYSVLGDLDLDGEITGSIVNGEATGDLAMMVDGWLEHTPDPNVYSWRRGDLNQDGTTDLSDFVLMRDALGGEISLASFSLLVSGQGIPEPASIALLSLGIAASLASRRGRI